MEPSKVDSVSEHVLSGFILNLVLGFLSYLIPKNKKQILLGSRYGRKFNGSPKQFFLNFSNNNTEDCKVIWITASKKIFSELNEKDLPVVLLYSLKGFIVILRSEYLIFSHNCRGVSYSFFLPGRFKKIETWHGIPPLKGESKRVTIKQSILANFVKKLELKDKKSYHTILATSEGSKRVFLSFFQNKNVRMLGFPRNDIFFDKSSAYVDYKKKLDLGKYKKILLYCPTWRDNPTGKHPFSQNFLKDLNYFLKSKNYVLLDKRHANERFEENYAAFSNIINATYMIDDVQDLLIHVDIMITDYSSTFMDYCLIDGQVIFYPYDIEEYKNLCRELKIDYFNDIPGPFVKNENELIDCIKNITEISSNKDYKIKYQEFKDRYHFYQDGDSSQRLYSYLMSNNKVD